MKILKEGKLPNPNKIICNTCGTEFEYEGSDIKEKINKNKTMRIVGIGGCVDNYIKSKIYYVECPLCKEQFYINSKIISVDTLSFDEMWSGRTEEFEKRIKWND